MSEYSKEHGIKHSRSQALIDYAYAFAREAHRGQKRKYTGRAYIEHPVAVAKQVAEVTEDCEMICAALLHDVMEDCGKTSADLEQVDLGFGISSLVLQLTDISRPEDGNRAIRKRIDLDHTAKASPEAKTIKLADLIDNSHSIIKYDPGFAKVYMREKEALLGVLGEGDETLYIEAWGIVRDYWELCE